MKSSRRRGTLQVDEHARYEGWLEDGEQSGRGVLIFSDPESAEDHSWLSGSWAHGSLEGPGTFRSADGAAACVTQCLPDVDGQQWETLQPERV